MVNNILNTYSGFSYTGPARGGVTAQLLQAPNIQIGRNVTFFISLFSEFSFLDHDLRYFQSIAIK